MNTSSRFLIVLLAGVALGLVSFSVWTADPSVAVTGTSLIAAPSTTTSSTTTIPEPTSTSVVPTTTTTTVPPKGELVIQGTGDVAVDPGYIPALASKGWDYAWSGLNGFFLHDDLTVINLECTPSDIGKPLGKAFTFRCPTAALPSLKVNGVEVANMGNNHSGDYGKDALVDGRANLIAAGLGAVGAGKDLNEAGAPALYDIKGWKVAVIGFGGVAPDNSWYATADRPGMRSGDHNTQMVEAVKAAKAVADIVVVAIHWGVELDTTPRSDDIQRAKEMIAAGADIIFGSHPHRMQPLEFIDGKPVFWSLGNFVWPHNSVPSATTAVARAVINPDGSIDACLIPAYIESHGHPELTGDPECGPPWPDL